MKYLLVIVLLFAGFQGVFSQNSAEQHNDLGLQYYINGQYDDAISEFTEAMKENPNNAVLFFNRGFAYFQKTRKDWEQIKSDFTEAIKLDENHAAAYFWRGYAYQHHYPYDLDKAIFDFTKSIGFQYNLANSYNNRAYAYAYEYYDKRDYAKALADYNEALKIEPESELFIANRAKLFYDFKKYQLAIEEYTRVIAKNPENGFYYCMHGLSYSALEKWNYSFKGIATAQELEKWNQIIDDLTKSSELGFDDEGMYGMGYTLENYQWKKRISEATIKIKNDRNNPALYEILGDIYFTGYETNEYQNSGYVRYYNERFKAKERMKYIEPGVAVFDGGIGGAGGSGFGNDWVNALENYNKVLQLTSSPTAWLNIKTGIVILYNYQYNPKESKQKQDTSRRARVDKAIPYFIKASQLNPDNKLAYHWLGYLYYEKADYQSAIKAYTDVLRIDLQDTLALHNRGVLFHDAKDYSRAITDYAKALKIDPNSGSRDTKWYLDVATRSRNEN